MTDENKLTPIPSDKPERKPFSKKRKFQNKIQVIFTTVMFFYYLLVGIILHLEHKLILMSYVMNGIWFAGMIALAIDDSRRPESHILNLILSIICGVMALKFAINHLN